MTSMIRALFIVIVVSLAGMAVAAAQGIPTNPAPTPVSPPPPVGTLTPPPPGLSVWVVESGNNFNPYGLPYDFNFTDALQGYGFKAGEHVTITPQNVAARPLAVIADGYGNFSAQVSFTWVFCGPHAATPPAPSFIASGSSGTTASASQRPPLCPSLLAVAPHDELNPVPSSGVGVVGTAIAQPAGTAVARPMGTPVPPGHPVPPGYPGPPITPRPQTVAFQVQAFGFAAGERITLRAENVVEPAPAPAQVTADAMGRFRLSYTATVTPCSAARGRVVATGDAGTSAVTTLLLYAVCPLCSNEMSCVPPVDPGSLPAPGPPSPSSNPQVAGTGSRVGVTVQHASVQRGKYQRVAVLSDASGTAALTVTYAGGKTDHLHASVVAGRRAVTSWRVPRTVHRGQAKVLISIAPAGVVLNSSFRVR